VDVLAIIPARGGSKSLPRKNVVDFLGHPLIWWSVRAGLEAATVTRVIVSTDDTEIAEVAAASGAEVPFLRPAALAADDTRDLPVFQHALEWLAERESYRPDLVVQLRPTSPLRPAGLVDEGVRLLADEPDAHSVRAVCEPLSNPYKMWRIEDDRLVPLLTADLPEPYNAPRQHLPATYWQIGLLDVVRPAVVLGGSMSGEVILPIVVDQAWAVDIDDAASLRRGEEAAAQSALADRVGGQA
jgi:CMP-N-acetylneuraminic acid synthetase